MTPSMVDRDAAAWLRVPDNEKRETGNVSRFCAIQYLCRGEKSFLVFTALGVNLKGPCIKEDLMCKNKCFVLNLTPLVQQVQVSKMYFKTYFLTYMHYNYFADYSSSFEHNVSFDSHSSQ